MGKIRVLSEVVASQVAAGEVVERPASVLKELLENSLDAGAASLEVEVRGAGSALLRVTDDGGGMDREDALMALERHATSKISTADDLSSVQTMGFRGEALPSIASVSEFLLRTRAGSSPGGTEAVVRGGKLVAVRDAGCANGTTVEVKSLFFNVPARRKFLRSAATETSHLDHVVETVALAFPAVAMHYAREGRTVHRLAPASGAAVRVADLYGAEEGAQLFALAPRESGGLRISGLVSRPGVTRADRARQFFFVNGRAVENSFISAGLREAYRQMLEPGRYPSVFLYLEMDPQEVDCNVHPAKREVRFRRGSLVRDAVRDAVESALREARAEWLRPLRTHMATTFVPTSNARPAIPSAAHQPELAPAAVPEARPARMVAPTAPPAATPATASSSAGAGEFRLIGGLSARYLLLEGSEGLVLLDRRAARLRILFERLQRGLGEGGVAAQRLLMPAVFELPARSHEAVVANIGALNSCGFGVEIFGGRSLKVEALPDFLGSRDPQRVLEDFAERVLSSGGTRARAALTEDAARRAVAGLAAEPSGPSDERHDRALVGQLLSCELPYCDPEGRPVMLQFSWRELDRKFGRA
ncbi:MAG: mismatch repair endonuclease MutL [Verrucomicrobiota bacterium]